VSKEQEFTIWPVLFIAIGLAYLAKTFWRRDG